MTGLSTPQKQKFQFFGLIVFLGVCIALDRISTVDPKYYESFLSRYPMHFSAPVFVVLYVGLSFVLWTVKDLFKVVGAVLYGAYWSTLFVCIAETINAVILFHLAHKLGRGYVENHLSGRWARLDEKIKGFGFLDLFLLRAVVLVPFRFLDLAAGLSKINFKKYITAVILGSPVRIFFVQFFMATFGASFGKNFDAIAEYLMTHQMVLVFSWIYFLAAVFLTVRLVKRLRDKN